MEIKFTVSQSESVYGQLHQNLSIQTYSQSNCTKGAGSEANVESKLFGEPELLGGAYVAFFVIAKYT